MCLDYDFHTLEPDPFDLDPDLDDVPPTLRAQNGRIVTIVTPDGVAHAGTLRVSPGLFGDARRTREDAA